jgi:polyhydroxybutyrate depolymerase
MSRIAALLGLVLTGGLLSACHRPTTGTPPTGTSVGATTHTITVDGRQRTFIVYEPAQLPGPAPLVVFLHGGFGSGSQAEKSYGWDAQADTAHFVVAYPDGVDRAWNTGGGCCGVPASSNIADVAFITAMVASIESDTSIDDKRVYATGISNGGIMSYTLACSTDLFAAIGPDSATMLGDCPHATPLSVIHIHGTADKNIPYAGGTGDGVAHIDGPAVPALNQTWRAIDSCATPATTTAHPVTTSTASCPGGRQVELITIAGAGHQWPGGVAKPVIQKLIGTDPPSTALDATQTIWSFFARHAKD